MARELILVVDDEPGVRTSVGGILKDEGYRVDAAATGEECLKKVQATLYDLILLDVWLPGMDGLEVLERLGQTPFSGQVVVISGHGTIEMAVKAIRCGAYDFIEKPMSLEKTLVTVKNALRQKELEDQNRLLKERLVRKDVMVGRSIPIMALRKQVEIIAPTNGRILIYGENGTGKELVARLVHEKSLRRNKKFVEINCAAIPDDLIESELFGYRRGAFTGAGEDKRGKFEEAHEGTLFLDEVGDMSLKVQSKLLRVLEEEKIEPLGCNSPLALDVRVIAATNQDLSALILAGRFREDLFYRLNVIPVQIIPLRERSEDIPLLVEHFLGEFSRMYGKKAKEVTLEAMNILGRYTWPGNVRELKNVMERLVITQEPARITPYDLPSGLFRAVLEQEAPPAAGSSFQAARERFERQYILEALHRHGGNILQTAREMELDRSTLYKKIKQYDIEVG
ncbi:MAG: sigma-54-dependent Fis family transcriptional regulator [Acidobacteria bacterium]|nr:sigma-54-dependent Fis family transcriptional regulator [Acidobacteriota bacterium]